MIRAYIKGFRDRHSGAAEGAVWMMISAASWAVMVSVARGLRDEIHTFEIVFFRSIFALMFLLPLFWSQEFTGLRTKRFGMHLARGVSGLAALYLLFGALVFIPMGDVAAITFTRPLLASLCAILFMGEVAKGHRWTAVIFGLIGAYIIVRPGVSPVSWGQGLALICVVAMVVTSMTVKSLTRTEQADTIVVWQMIIFTAISVGPALYVWTTPTMEQFAVLLLMGFAGAIAQRAMTRAYKAADATIVLPFEYTRLPFAALMGLALFSEFPDVWVWVGGTIIFAATFYMAQKERQEVRAEREKKAAGTADL
jgi:drug/metabolite transporter (DMT)-like permease